MFRLILNLLAGLTLSAAAAAAPADAIDTIVLSEMKRQLSPAVGLAVVKDGKAVKVRGYGLANVEHRAAATAQTPFQTASVGKQFTAALVLLLVRDGKLALDAPVSRYLQGTPPAWQGITVRHLLTHTSGLEASDSQIDLRKDYTEQQLLASAYRLPLRSPPGDKHAYSNLGYQVLGVLCSSVGEKFWGEQLRERVFLPLGMTARVISERDIVPKRAAGYDLYEGELENQAWVAPGQNTTADGSLYVTPQDMARWSVALPGSQILTQEEKAAMWTPATLNDGQRVDYGFGWKLFTDAGLRLVRHRGDWQGFTTHILHLPEDRLTISVLMNRARGQPHVIADRIAAQYVPALRKPPLVAPSTAVLARAPLFLRGGMNDWQDSAPLLQVEPGLFQARVTLQGGMQQFKITGADAKATNLGARFDEAVVRPARAKWLEFGGEDLFFEVDKPGDFVFQLELRGNAPPRLTVSPVAVAKPL